MVDYSKILKQAYRITIENKFLWIFGLFLSLASTLAMGDEKQPAWHPPGYAVALLLIVIILLLLLYFRCRASLVIGIKAILDRQETSVRKSFDAAKFFYSRLFVVYLKVEISLLLVGILVLWPIFYMFGHNFIYRGIFLSVIGLIILVPSAIAAGLVNVIAPMFVVIYDLPNEEAIQRSLELIGKFWLPLMTLGLLMFLPQLLILLLSVPIVFLAHLPYHMIGLTAAIICGIILQATYAIVAVFQQSVWVLAFQDLVKPQKLTEEEPEIVPEIVG